MQVLLRNLISGKFFTPDGEWSSEKPEARRFPNTAEAVDEVRRLNLKDIQVVLVFAQESDLAGST